jgi:hypothetical protein
MRWTCILHPKCSITAELAAPVDFRFFPSLRLHPEFVRSV